MDRGWSWIVLLGAFYICFLSFGYLQCIGVFLLDWQEDFNAKAQTVGWTSAFCIGGFGMAGPLSSIVSSHVTCRTSAFFGGLIAVVAYLGATFANSLTHIFIIMAFTGLGLGLSFISTLGILGFYFKKYLALATGIALSGSGIGVLILAPLTRYLIDEYSWRGTMIITAAILGNICVGAFLYRPTPMEVRIMKAHTTAGESNVNEVKGEIVMVDIRKTMVNVESKIATTNEENSQMQSNSISESLLKLNIAQTHEEYSSENQNNAITVKSNFFTMDEENTSENQSNSITFKSKNSAMDEENSSENQNNSTTFKSKTSAMDEENSSENQSNSTTFKSKTSAMDEENSSENQSNSITFKSKTSAMDEENSSENQSNSTTFKSKTSAMDEENSSENQSNSIMKSEVVHSQPLTTCQKISTFFSSYKHLFTVRFTIIWIICMYFGGFGYYSAVIYFVPNIETDKGLSKSNAAVLLGILGAFSSVGRLFFGPLIDFGIISPVKLAAITEALAGIFCLLSVFAETFVTLIIYCIGFGISSGIFGSLASIVLRKIVPIEDVKRALGFGVLGFKFGGCSAMPLMGYLKDISGTYYYPFYVAGGIMVFNSCLFFLDPAWVALDKRKDPEKMHDG